MNEFVHSMELIDCVAGTLGTMEKPDEPGDTTFAN